LVFSDAEDFSSFLLHIARTEKLEKQIDLRGLNCPAPVLKTKALLDDKTVQRVDALVDGEVNVNNLSRLARSLKMQVTSATEENAEGKCFKVTITRSSDGADSSPPNHSHAPGRASTKSTGEQASNNVAESVGTVIFLSKDRFGDGDPEFSNTLISLFLQTAFSSGHRPRAILLANSGVRLLHRKSSSFKVLQDFKSQGVEVLACGLCVEFYGLKDEIPTEQITNMFAIAEFLFAADKVLTP
jgi:selenium metabolism protein YedF